LGAVISLLEMVLRPARQSMNDEFSPANGTFPPVDPTSAPLYSVPSSFPYSVMSHRPIPLWPRSPLEARALQRNLRSQVLLSDPHPRIRFLAAADVAYSKRGNWAWAGAHLFSYPELEILEEQYAGFQVTFPYIPGLLSFREGPALQEVLSRLQGDADLILFDGQGIAHPEGLGLASHLGVLLQKSTIGCAKSRLA